jgi:hypothetical protein
MHFQLTCVEQLHNQTVPPQSTTDISLSRELLSIMLYMSHCLVIIIFLVFYTIYLKIFHVKVIDIKISVIYL